MGSDEPNLAICDSDIGAVDLGAALSNRFDLLTKQDQPALDGFEGFVVMSSLAIFRKARWSSVGHDAGEDMWYCTRCLWRPIKNVSLF